MTQNMSPKTILPETFNKVRNYIKKNKHRYTTVGEIRKYTKIHPYSIEKAVLGLFQAGEITQIKTDAGVFYKWAKN